MILKEYVRGTGNRKIGMVVAVDKGKVGFSLCHNNDEFNAKQAEQMAVGRATKLSEDEIWRQVPDSVIHSLEKMYDRSLRYFK